MSLYFGQDSPLRDYEDMEVDTREDMRPTYEDDSNLLDHDDDEIRQQILQQCLDFMDVNTLKSLRLCNRTWQQIIDAFRPLTFPAIYRLPHELTQHIFEYLSPVDFNSARHTCHAWMLAGLDLRLLKAMLARGGWSRGLRKGSLTHVVTHPQNKTLNQLARHLARECSLLHRWPGNGLRRSVDTPAEYGQRCGNALAVQYSTDFTELSSADYSGKSCGLGFTLGNCGRYLLIAEGCAIYVYSLDGISIRPVTTVICPKRVLAMSMDTSAGRHSLAALLDGRMGMVCDLETDPVVTEQPPSPQVYSDRSSEDELGLAQSAYASASIHDNDNFVAAIPRTGLDEGLSRVNSIHVLSPNQSVHVRNASRMTEENRVVQDWPTLLPTTESCPSIPTSSAPLSIYHSLCSPDDPPRSVAICPSRRCLAFGCGAGIELHWVDAMSGRNLMKWFPLTSASDFLYFLPSRRNIDNPNKLRLISSKAGPGQRGGIERFARRKNLQRNFVWSWGRGVREAEYDHYAALPLSDGAHVIYTLPATGGLILGSDAPLGGPTKLLRKIQFEPPSGVVCSKESAVSMYAAGSDLTFGVRVVAVYQDDLVLYTVPPDVFRDIKPHSSTDAPGQNDGEVETAGIWKDWWQPSCLAADSSSSATTVQSVVSWPIVVRGAKIGHLDNIVDLAVQSSAELVVWAVSTNGLAYTWTLTDGSAQKVVQRHVEQDGSVHMLDEEGDWSREDDYRNINVSSLTNEAQYEAVMFANLQGDVYMEDADAYDVAYPEAETSNAYRPFALHADRDSSVSLVSNRSNDAGEGPSRRCRFDLDGVCEFEIHDQPTVDYSACVTMHKKVIHGDVRVDEVEGPMPFPVEVLCGDQHTTMTPFPTARVANTSAKREPAKQLVEQADPKMVHR